MRVLFLEVEFTWVDHTDDSGEIVNVSEVVHAVLHIPHEEQFSLGADFNGETPLQLLFDSLYLLITFVVVQVGDHSQALREAVDLEYGKELESLHLES